jgi:hypothetical protein
MYSLSEIIFGRSIFIGITSHNSTPRCYTREGEGVKRERKTFMRKFGETSQHSIH